MPIDVIHFTDPGCPWAYSASPALSVLRWRFGDELRWRHVMIGLAESYEQYVARGYTPQRSAISYARFRRRFGMPFGNERRTRPQGTSVACRGIVARGSTWEALRDMQFAWFTTAKLYDEVENVRAVLGEDIDPDDPAVVERYEAGRAEARTAEGSPTEAMGRTATTDGPVRFTAPSLIFRTDDGRALEAGGFQPLEAYDVCIANLDPTLPRREPPEDVLQLLRAFDGGLAVAEVAACLAERLDAPDPVDAETRLITSGAVCRPDGRWVAP